MLKINVNIHLSVTIRNLLWTPNKIREKSIQSAN
uniref:Uncharacterized protein n=1 Tax=Rhizophora mucronata TaxID=61149 RepID=A0A2P2R0D2_RHIMU